MQYDLNRFSAQSFERFIQALAVSQLGLATKIYGGGRDGAREATYEGQCTPLPGGPLWNGYVVVQAKCSASKLDNEEAYNWLRKEVEKEFKKFESPRRKLKRPKYYILASNVKLTPPAANAEGKGGGTLDKMLEHLEVWRERLGIAEICLWHADTLCSLVDAHPGVRQTFSAWTMPGDVLYQIAQQFQIPRFTEVVYRVLKKELFQHRGINTRDSGQWHGRQLYIDEVFVDLPLSTNSFWNVEEDLKFLSDEEPDPLSDVDEDHGLETTEFEQSADDQPNEIDHDPTAFNSIRNVLDCLSDKLDVLETDGQREVASYQRIVILGGPGQGKSTLGQFLAQLLRALLIQRSGKGLPETLDIAKATIERAVEESLPLGGPIRFPIHVKLPNFADAISDNTSDSPSILRFVAKTFASLSDENITAKIMRDWIAAHPSVIILDGLDEVPRTGNRSAVIEAINALVEDVHEANADTLVLVTSRPQGYSNDLSPKYWKHWHLEDLDTTNAMRFASRLSTVLMSEPERVAEVLNSLRLASAEPSTAALMVSPLQISLLLSLIMTRNDIPKDRWTLFDRHYQTLRDREIAKGDETGDLIRRFRSEIDRIHYDAGFILQVRAENSGKASAYFTPAEFKKLIERHIRDSITEEAQINEAIEKLSWIATTRLVFLGDRNEDRITFDVRSLQEFMAAARIMVSPEAQIVPRLSEIALKAHWQHVFRIACSKVYAQPELQEFRREICTILDGMDIGDVDAAYREIRAGARLAISLLKDSTAGARQTDRVQLMNRATGILQIDAPKMMEALAQCADRDTLQSLSRAINEALGSDRGLIRSNAFRVLFTITRDNEHSLNAWAKDLLQQTITNNPGAFSALTDAEIASPQPREIAEALFSLMWMMGPTSARQLTRAVSGHSTPNPILAIPDWGTEKEQNIAIKDRSGKVLEKIFLVYQPLNSFAELPVGGIPKVGIGPGWKLLSNSVDFSINPSIESLCTVVECAIACPENSIPLSNFPWVIGACMRRAYAIEEPWRVLDDIKCGNYGQPTDWKNAEKQWLKEGLAIRDVVASWTFKSDLNDFGIIGGPPIKILRSASDKPNCIPLLIDESVGWSIEYRTTLLPILLWLARDSASTNEVFDWISDDLIAQDWDDRLLRRAVTALNHARSETFNSPQLAAITNKIAQGDFINFKSPYPLEVMVKRLASPLECSLAANILAGGINLSSAAFRKAFEDVRPELLVPPPDANRKTQLSFFMLKGAARLATKEEARYWGQIVAEEFREDAVKLIKRLYKGKRDNIPAEEFALTAAELSLAKGVEQKGELVEILATILGSRQSCFEDETALSKLQLPKDVEGAPR